MLLSLTIMALGIAHWKRPASSSLQFGECITPRFLLCDVAYTVDYNLSCVIVILDVWILEIRIHFDIILIKCIQPGCRYIFIVS